MTRPVPGAGNPLTVPWIRCLDTGKRGYQSRADAKKVIARWQTRDKGHLWAYKCQSCGNHHIGHSHGLDRVDHRAHHEAGTGRREPADPTWVPLVEAARMLRASNPERMARILERAIREGKVNGVGALGVYLIHRDEIPRLRVAAHDARQDSRLKEL